MGLSFDALLPNLEALAYLCEIVIAQQLFLRHLKVRKSRRPLSWAGMALMFVAGALTGIPEGSSLARFSWYFLMMGWQVLCALSCFQGGVSTVMSACMAGFATQHIANKVTILCRLNPAVEEMLEQTPALGIPLEVLVFSVVYALAYVVFAKHIRPGNGSWQLDVLSGSITFLCIGVNRLVADNSEQSVQYEAAVCLYAIIGCIFALIIQVYISRWEEERSQAIIMRRLLEDSERRYGQWKSWVDQLRIITHDIKHMLAQAQELAEKKQVELPDLDGLRETVDRFSSPIHTGNDVLDVLLRNMTDLCMQDHITLNCAIYTDQLKHFDGTRLYFLFNNAIDNAMKSAALVADPDKRIIDVSIRRFGSSVVIHIWNYYTGELVFVNGLPVTRRDRQTHGFGMKSIQLIVEQFGGALNIHTENEVFNLDIMLPLAQEGEGQP